MSNVHPDMSGNPCDEPLTCDRCGDPVREDDVFGSAYDASVVLCSSNCAEIYDERMAEFQGGDK